MSAAWAAIIALALGTAAIKAIGPAVFGSRDLPVPVLRVVGYFAPALLAALIVVETFGTGSKSLTIDARAVGLAAAGFVLVTTESLIGAVVASAVVTALTRLLL